MLHLLKDLSTGIIGFSEPAFGGPEFASQLNEVLSPGSNATHFVFSDNTLIQIDKPGKRLVVVNTGNAFISQDYVSIYIGETVKWVIIGNLSKYEP